MIIRGRCKNVLCIATQFFEQLSGYGVIWILSESKMMPRMRIYGVFTATEMRVTILYTKNDKNADNHNDKQSDNHNDYQNDRVKDNHK